MTVEPGSTLANAADIAPPGIAPPGTAPPPAGEMGRRIWAYDWSKSPLGPMEYWPQSLRTAVSICLGSRFPMMLWWGPELTNIYNDAFIPVLGGWHPNALGKSGRDVWADTWPVIGQQVEEVMKRGGSTLNERVRLVYTRHGYPETTWFTWSFGPIYDESGSVGGLFNTCHEDTQHVLAERERDRLADQRRLALDAAQMGWWHYDPATKIATFDERYGEIFALTGPQRPIDVAMRRVHPEDLPGLWAKVEAALDPHDPQPYAGEFRIVLDDGSVRWAEAYGAVEFEGEGEQRRAVSFVGTVRDVTAHKAEETERAKAEAALRESEQRLSAILENTTAMVYVVDANDRFQFINRRWEAMFGLTNAMTAGRSVFEFFPRETADSFAANNRKVLESGETLTSEEVVPQEDGLHTYVSVKVPLFDAHGEPYAVCGISTDITDRTRTEERLRRTHDTFYKLIQNDPFGVYVVDADFRLRQVSLGAQKVFATVPDPLLGRDFAEVLRHVWAEPFATEAIETFRHTLATGEPYVAPSTVRQRQDTDDVEAYDWRIERVRLPDGRYGVVCYFYDLSERQQFEAALRDSEERFRQLADAMPQIVWVTRADGYHEYFNRRWYEFTGAPDGTTDGEGWNALFHPKDRERAWAAWRHSLTTGEPYEIEYRLRHHSGEYRWTLGRALPILDADGAVARWYGTCTDIDALKQLQREREDLLARERVARAEAERASEAKSEFLATLSHELRTPLAPVMLTVSLLENHPALASELREDVATIRRNVELESRLISDLLDLTRIEKGKLQLDEQDVDVHLVLRSAVDICQREASAHLVTDLRARRHVVRGDSTRLQQVFWNLIINAIKFTGEQGTITVRSANTGEGCIRVEVSDTGVGIDPAVLPRLFTAFEQGEVRAARQQAGLGLGLSISKKLAELHGGTITASSEGRGKGATFAVELPTVEALVPPPTAQPVRPSHAFRPLDVLLVEDHEGTLNVMLRLLRGLGHRVTGVTSAASAVAAAQQGEADLMICDLGLPDGSGLDVMRAVRDKFEGRAVALTGYGMESDIGASRAAGFAEHLTKPVDLAALEAAIDRLVVSKK
jgi:PAS domain S-box-containing protein